MSSTISTNVTMNITPRDGQSEEEAAAEFLQLFKEYLQEPESPFMTDYGADAWGGYEGPFVDAVTVEELAYDFDTTVALSGIYPAFLMRYITQDRLSSTGTTEKDLRIRHSDLMKFLASRAGEDTSEDEDLTQG